MKTSLLVALAFLLPLGGYAQTSPVGITEQGGRYTLSLSEEALGRDMLLTTRVVELSGHKNISAGQTFFPGLVLRFVLQGDRLLAEKVGTPLEYDGSSGYARAVEANNIPAYAFVFDVKTVDGRVEIDVTRFFGEEIARVCPLPAGFKAGKFESSLSGIVSFDNRPDRINIATRLVYSGVKDQFSAVVSYNLMLMDESAQPRSEDPRVGYMTVSGSAMTEDGPLRNRRYITRWRIEPRPEDRERYLRGEAVVPARPIVFYIDPALPDYIARYARVGILDWNRAFEKIGFRDAVQVRDIPNGFNGSDVLVNMLRYIPNSTANAMGATIVDPRSGEIIQGDIYWFHNVVDLLLKWRFVQTAAADPAVRSTNLSEERLGEMIRYVAAHEMGHVLGLKHNMRGSYAYPVDSLRSPSFTAEYGTTASIMDYARFNYVAQPGDPERGVRLMPPVLGAYDYMAIEWGYRYFEDRERQGLEAIFTRAAGDPKYSYANSLMGPIVSDPAAQSDMLGDDLIRSSEYGIANLRYMTAHLIEWCAPLADPHGTLTDRYEAIVRQFFKYLANTASYIGGAYYLPLATTDLSPRYDAVATKTSREAAHFVFGQLNGFGEWLADDRIYAVIGDKTDVLLKEQASLLSAIMKAIPRRILISGADLPEELSEISITLFAPGTGQEILSQSLQFEYIARLKELAQPKQETVDPADRIAAAAAAYELSQIPGRLPKTRGTHYKIILNELKQ